MHVTIDGYGGSHERLSNEELVHAMLDRLPGQIGMTKIAPPSVCKYVGSNPLDWGVSGFVLIAESHISIHTFPERGYVWVDIFSCKAFDAEPAIVDFEKEFCLTQVATRVLERGLEYPHEVAAATLTAEWERAEVTATVGEGRQ